MNNIFRSSRVAMTVVGLALATAARAQPVALDPLSSWNDGPSKQAIIQFVTRAATEGSPDFVAPPDRVATFDNDGTLWCEQPVYFQALFLFDRIRQLAATNPELKVKQPYRAILEDDRATMATFGEQEFAALVAATHSGMTTDEFDRLARAWLDSGATPDSTDSTRNVSINRSLNCWRISGRTDSRRSSSRAAGSTSFAATRKERTEFLPTRWSAAVSRPGSSCVKARRC